MLTADATNQIGIALMAQLHTHLNELRYTWINGGERVEGKQAFYQVLRHKFRLNVVAAKAERGLSQVVGTEGEEVSVLSNLIGRYGCAGKLNHGADRNIQFHTLPGDGSGYYKGGSYYVLDAQATLELINQFFNPYLEDLTLEDMDILVP